MAGIFSAPKVPTPPPTPTEQDAGEAAKESQRRLLRGRVDTILTSGQGVENKSILGG